MAGCLFIERRNRERLSCEKNEVYAALKKGVNIFIYPEGKATEGKKVIRFKKPFFDCARMAQVDIYLCTVNYITVNGQAVNAKNKHQVLWYQNTSFIPHVWNVLGLTEITVQVNVVKLGFEGYKSSDTHESILAHELVSKTFTSLV